MDLIRICSNQIHLKTNGADYFLAVAYNLYTSMPAIGTDFPSMFANAFDQKFTSNPPRSSYSKTLQMLIFSIFGC